VESKVYGTERYFENNEKFGRNYKKKRSENNTGISIAKPKKSHYRSIVILLILSSKITTSCSFRSLSKIFASFNLYLNLELSSPSVSTTKLWIKKIGYAKLQSVKEKADDWIIIIDESIGIGQEKVLVILGIRRSKVDFTRPLRLQEMEPILVKSREKWTGTDIANELKNVANKLGKIIYAVSDAGSTLKYGLKETGIVWVYDITHAIAIILDKIYRNDEQFKEFTHNAGQMRFKNCCSKQAHLIPPNQRSKSRFLNIDIISAWGIKALKAYNKNDVSEEDRMNLKWVKTIESFIIEMNLIMTIVQEISIILKNEGLSKKTMTKCINCLKKCSTGKLLQFKKYMLEYLKENTKHIRKYKEKLVCCSDIIETTFGKYKNELSKNPMSGITDLVLIIPAIMSNLNVASVQNAIDNCTVKDIEVWKKENLCNSLLAKRMTVFKN